MNVSLKTLEVVQTTRFLGWVYFSDCIAASSLLPLIKPENMHNIWKLLSTNVLTMPVCCAVGKNVIVENVRVWWRLFKRSSITKNLAGNSPDVFRRNLMFIYYFYETHLWPKVRITWRLFCFSCVFNITLWSFIFKKVQGFSYRSCV